MSDKAQELPGELALQAAVAKGEWPHTMDAQKWATAWLEMMEKSPDAAKDEGAVLGWFANAIMAGYDAAMQRAAPAAELRAEARQLLELDDHRTPGDWHYEHASYGVDVGGTDLAHGRHVRTKDFNRLPYKGEGHRGPSFRFIATVHTLQREVGPGKTGFDLGADAAFIAAAPRMAALIRRLLGMEKAAAHV